MNPFQVMAHPVRRYLVELLAQYEAPVGEIADMIDCSHGIGWPAVSRHLKILHRAGFVRVRRSWPHRLYRLDDEAIVRLESSVAELRRLWDDRRGDGYFFPFEPDEAPWPPSRRGDRQGIGRMAPRLTQ
jgi:DNA-binding transcriptional ArsR family regulator